MEHSWAWRQWSLKINKIFLTPPLSRFVSHVIVPSSWTSQSLLSWSLGLWSSFLFFSPQNPEHQHPMFSAAKGTPDLLIVSQFFLGCESEVQQNVFPHRIFIHLCQEAVTSVPEKPPGLLVPCYVVPSVYTGLKFPMRQANERCFFSCLKKVLSTSWSGSL